MIYHEYLVGVAIRNSFITISRLEPRNVIAKLTFKLSNSKFQASSFISFKPQASSFQRYVGISDKFETDVHHVFQNGGEVQDMTSNVSGPDSAKWSQ